MKILELFAGDRSFGKVAERKGHEVFSVDWEAYDGIHLVKDIGHLEINDLPWIPHIVWASPDCTTYTISAISHHRRNRTEPFSSYAAKCDRVNQHLIDLIMKLKSINPRLLFYIENPRGMLRHMPFMQDFKRHTVWYCKYGDDRAKPTDIWTNSNRWEPRPECHNYKYGPDGKIIDRHCHHQSARRGARTGTQGRKNSYERSKIPAQLCTEILEHSI